MPSRRILVTGGSGFIGTNLVQHYSNHGDSVVNIDIAPPRNTTQSAMWHKLDICDRAKLAKTVQDFHPDVILHFAARTDIDGKTIQDYPENTVGVSNVIAAALPLEVAPTVIFASSLLVCRLGYSPTAEDDYCPIQAYGESKVEGELRVRREAAHKFPWVIVRPTSIWGPWFGRPYRDFFDAVDQGWYIHPKSVRVLRHYGFVLNAVAQIDALTQHGASNLLGKTVYIADYEPINVKHWADTISEHLQARRIRELPLWLFRVAATVGDVLGNVNVKFPITSYRLNNMLTPALYDLAPVRSVLPELPFEFDSAVEQTCKWLRSAAGKSVRASDERGRS